MIASKYLNLFVLILFLFIISVISSCQSVNPYQQIDQCKIISAVKKIDNKTFTNQAVGVPPANGSVVKKLTVACEKALLCSQKNMADFLIKEQNISNSQSETYIKGGIVTKKEIDEFNNCFITYQIENFRGN